MVTLTRRQIAYGTAGLLFLPSDTRAADDGLEPFARIAHAREQVRNVDGPFTQTRTIALLATQVVSHGRVTLQRPDRLRWSLFPPDDVTFWVGPEGLAYRSAHGGGHVPAGAVRVAAALDDLRAVLGGDLSKLRMRWELSILRNDAAGIEVEATSKESASASLHRLRFALASDLIRPTRIELFDGPRDRTNIEFGTLLVNGPIDEALMHPPR
jgi:hypothetical protein